MTWPVTGSGIEWVPSLDGTGGLDGSGGSATWSSPSQPARSTTSRTAASPLRPVIQDVLPVPPQHRRQVAGQGLAQQVELSVVEVERREAVADDL